MRGQYGQQRMYGQQMAPQGMYEQLIAEAQQGMYGQPQGQYAQCMSPQQGMYGLHQMQRQSQYGGQGQPPNMNIPQNVNIPQQHVPEWSGPPAQVGAPPQQGGAQGQTQGADGKQTDEECCIM